MSKAAIIGCLLAVLAVLFSIPSGDPAWRKGEARIQPPSGPGVLVLDLKDNITPEELAAFKARTGLNVSWSSPVSADEGLVRVLVPDLAAAIKAVRDDPLVELAEPQGEMDFNGYPDDPLWDRQWNMRAIGVEAGWRAGAGRGIKVAVLDTGVKPVEDLKANGLKVGWSFVKEEPDFVDQHGHGTHVAGTIAQTTHNGTGVAGVAPGAQIMPFKVLSARGHGKTDSIAAAIDDAADRGAQVINMSLGGPHAGVLHTAIEKAARRGVVVVASAGNAGRSRVGCPGHAEAAVGVSATGPDGAPAPYSNRGHGVELAAPGGNTRLPGGGILQATVSRNGDEYQAFQGTSMASPHVAGAVAVLMGMGLSGEAAVRTLMATADASGLPKGHGAGRLRLKAAISRVIWRTLLPRLVIGLLIAWLLVRVVRLGGAAPVLMALTALAVSGIFVAPLLPIPPGTATTLLGRGLFDWPAALGFGGLGRSLIWTSALIPVALSFLLGLARPLAMPMAAVAIAFGVRLVTGAWAGDLHVFDTGWLNTGWLALNGLIALGAAAAVVGAYHLNHQKGIL